MDLDISSKSLEVFSALDSDIRIKIIQLLSHHKMNVTQLALQLNLSNAIMTKHLDKLEAAQIIKTKKREDKDYLPSILILLVFDSLKKFSHAGIKCRTQF